MIWTVIYGVAYAAAFTSTVVIVYVAVVAGIDAVRALRLRWFHRCHICRVPTQERYWSRHGESCPECQEMLGRRSMGIPARDTR